MRLIYLIITGAVLVICCAGDEGNESDGDTSRKILGSSVVTSVSVVMDAGNKKNTLFTDAVGKPQPKPLKPSELASPIDLLNPDRYEFYTFDDNGDLVKRLMSLDEIRSIIATGDSDVLMDLDSFTSQGFLPEKRVSDVVTSVQSVVKDEMEIIKDPIAKPIFDTPDVSDTWSMILPAVFGNSGEDIKPEKPAGFVTPETIMVEPTSHSTSGPNLVDSILSSTTSTKNPSSPIYYSSPSPQLATFNTPNPQLKVEIISNGGASTEKKPTRPTINTTSMRPFLVRNQIKTTNRQPSTTQKTSPKPVTFTSPSQTSTTTKPTVTTPKPSSTVSSMAPSTTSTKPNIFGIPADLFLTESRPTSSGPVSRPISDFFGLPSLNELKNNLTSSTKSTTIQSSSTTKITVKPQLSISSTVTNSKTGTTVHSSIVHPTTVHPTTWAPSPEDTQFFNIFKEVLGQTLSSDNSSIGSNSEESTTDTAAITHVLNFESSKVPTTEVVSEYLTTETVTTTKLPPLLSSLNNNEILSASELLDQLLVTTNIYEINTELATAKQNLTSDPINTTTNIEQDVISYPPTTDIALMQSIGQLFSQAVGDVETIVNQTTEAADFTRSNDLVISKEGEAEINTTTTEAQTISTNSEGVTDEISGSTGAILSQTNGQVTEGPQSFITNRRNDVTEATTSITEDIATKTAQETTTYYYLVRAKPSEFPDISTTNRNRTKPAKYDISLEQEVIAEELKIAEGLKNITSTQNKNTTELLKMSESNVVSVQSNATTTEDVPSTTDKTMEDYTSTITNEVATDEPAATTETTATPSISTTTTIVSTTITTQRPPKPSIVITLNQTNTIVTENEKIVANKTIFTQPITTELSTTKIDKNSTQDQTWTLVSTVAPQQAADQNLPPPTIPYPEIIDSPPRVDLVPKPMQGFGLEESTSSLDIDVHQFVQLCNELAFGFWKSVTTGLSPARSIFISPFASTSMLAMVFLGAKGSTSEEMNEILKLDDMVTFNPHLTFKSISESIVSEPGTGIATTAIIRELFSDRSKGKLLDFYKNRVRAFYDGFVEEVSYREIGDVIRRRSNLLVKKYTNGKYPQFLSDASITARSPLSGVGINIFETDCSQTSTEGRDGELHFIVYPSLKQRRLVPIPAVVYKNGFLAGYEPSVDATAVALGNKDQVVSTILVVPGQQGIAAPVDGLTRLEKRLVESSFKKGAWSRLLRSLIPRPGLEVQIPRYSHKSVINATNTLQRMGLHELFNSSTADLRGLNGVANELHLSDVLQINKFATCGEMRGDDTQHSEVYPATTMRGRAARRLRQSFRHSPDQEEPRDYQRAFHDPLHDPLLFALPLSLRPRQARIPEVPRLRFDRPFLYFVRHNPTGLILHMGRFNPRLLP
ncbi:uncharacterized protein [Euwallacea fornicatus]|uniref:uncharacterized protein n=1 Tax=Euwallacea fornicatus TaxID=995702 RepID=UPI00338F120A